MRAPEHSDSEATVYPFPTREGVTPEPPEPTPEPTPEPPPEPPAEPAASTGTDLEPAPDTAPEQTRGKQAWGSLVKTTKEAKEALDKLLDGTFWSARPPSLRDLRERAKRRDRFTGIPVLDTIWDGLEVLSFVLACIAQALRWLVSRPARLLGAIILAAIACAFVWPEAMKVIGEGAVVVVLVLMAIPPIWSYVLPGALSWVKNLFGGNKNSKH